MGVGGMVAAQAQTWQGRIGNYTLQGCYAIKTDVQCDLTITSALTGQDGSIFEMSTADIQVYSPTGARSTATRVNVMGGTFGPYISVPVVNGIPIKIAFQLSAPVGTRSIRVIIIDGHRIDNVIVAQASASAVPAPTGMQVVRAGVAYNATMSGCTTSGTTITCTNTVLTPAR